MNVTAMNPARHPAGPPPQPRLMLRGPRRWRRRRPLLWLVGAALVLLGGMVTALFVDRVGDRVAVLAVARPVPVGQTLGEADLTVARVPADPALHPVPAARRGEMVGRTSAVELRPGTLLTAADVTDVTIPAAGQQLVGVPARPGQLPARGLRPGDRVLVVPVPGDQATPDNAADGTSVGGGSVPAWVAGVGPVDASGAVTVDVVVPTSSGPDVAALASTGRVALILQPASTR